MKSKPFNPENCAAEGKPLPVGLEAGRVPASSEEAPDLGSLVSFLSMVLDNVYSGIIVCDTNCRIVFMNRVYADLLGTDPAQAVGKPIEEYFVASRLPNVMASGRPELGQRCSLRTATPMLVNRIPLRQYGRTVGVILQTIFRDYQAFTDLMNRMHLLEREVSYYKKGLDRVLSPLYSFGSIVGQSRLLTEVKEVAAKYAATDAPVLILGATGTGKEMFAHAVHAASPRAGGPFVCVNCAAIPRELLESELFGYESGAFTGASKKGKVGQIQLAHQGTLYLDEIGELSLKAQAKLLRVLETKRLERLGGVQPMQIDFRLVAATNRDLKAMMSQGQFRDDLYYRLSTMSVEIPPLVKRVEDIGPLVEHFLKSLDRPRMRLSPAARQALENYAWPGNVRELKNVLERALSLAEGAVIDLEHLPPEVIHNSISGGRVSDMSDSNLADELSRCEASILAQTLRLNQGNMSKTAKILGISRSTLYEKCRRYHLLRQEKSS
ncbi:MAG: PAS domain-containing protein [Desulfarculus sp.]|nr:MAG: PAS domain-containing protein [Desulfarculus sp.]